MWLCAVLALVGVAGANVLDLARTHPPSPIAGSAGPTDPATRAEIRFAAARAQFQARRITGHVGYFGDTPADRLGVSPGGIERYFSAQFALAPLILDGDGRDEWLVTDFDRGASAARLPPGAVLAADCGSGVRIFRRHP
jgi:hypothetical protein